MNAKHLKIHLLSVGIVVVLLLGAWLLEWVDFVKPIWLFGLLALPLFSLLASHGVAGLPSRTNASSTTLRCLLYILLIAALADIQYVIRSNTLAVYFLLDHSASIPEAIREKGVAYVNAAAKTKKRKDLAGLMVFAEDQSIELRPGTDFNIDTLTSRVKPDYTNLEGAVELAVTAFPANARKKIVIVSDGNQNAGNVVDAVRYAAGEGVTVSVLPVNYSYRNEVLVEKVQVPDKVKKNEPFEVRVQVDSLKQTEAYLTIYRNGEPLGRPRKVELDPGSNRYFVEMQVERSGIFVYTARISAEEDTIADNNEASNYVYIQGESKILFVTPEGNLRDVEHLLSICRAEDIKVHVMPPERFPVRMEQLADYDCVVLANVPATKFSENQMTMIRTCVKDLGSGLVMIGGQDSFGAGGYEMTPVEEALPVSMDIKQKKIMPKGALVLVLHTCEFAQGNFWAKKITKAAIDTVHPADEVGVVYYGNGDQWLFPLRNANNKPYLKNLVDKCEPGDMPSFAPAFSMALKGLTATDAMVRHIIVISDGDPARPSPADVDAMVKANITVSTVGINPHSPRDVQVLKYIAYKTKGRYYFVKDPKKLPQIFVKEAKVVKRSLIFNKQFQPLLATGSELTKGIRQAEVPPLLAYVATTPKDRALVSITSDNDNKDPLLAEWRYGLGKSVAFTSDASTNWARAWVPWPKYRRIWGQIIRWTTRKREKSNLTVQTKRDGDKVVMTIDAIDEKGRFINFGKLDARRVDSASAGHNLDVQQIGAGRYQATFTAKDKGVNLVNIAYDNPLTGERGFMLAGVALPYSSEYRKLEANTSLLQRIAQMGDPDGQLLDVNPAAAGIFDSDQPPSINMQPVWEYLLVIAVLLFMLDVVMRRVIVTREDIAAAWAVARERVTRRQRATEQDETMAALLKRKQQVFQDQAAEDAAPDKPEPKPAIPRESFKERLEREAAETGDSTERVEAESTDDTPKPDTAAGKPPAPPPIPEQPKEQSYTSRLLDAKRRAQKKPESDDD